MSATRQQSELFQQDRASSGIVDETEAVGKPDIAQFASTLDELRQRIDFPIGADEDILAVSRPPQYTACPNPWLGDGLSSVQSIADLGEPDLVTEDIRAGKNDPVYFAHSYPTKVPPQAIVPFIARYTRPGETVLDAFCGTGMTGVAAQLCADASYISAPDSVGARRAVLVDLGTAPAFIAAVTNRLGALANELPIIEDIVRGVADRYTHLLTTAHCGWARGTTDPKRRVNKRRAAQQCGHVEYVVWSDIIVCPNCATELVVWDLVFRGPKKAEEKAPRCSSCGSTLDVGRPDRVFEAVHDPGLGKLVRLARQVPVLLNYSVGSKRFEKTPDQEDREAIESARRRLSSIAYPVVQLPDGFNTAQPRRSHGFSHVHHFFTSRNLLLLTECWTALRQHESEAVRMLGTYLVTGAVQRVCRLNRYMPRHDRHVGPLSGTLYVGPLTAEIPATNYLLARVSDLARCPRSLRGNGIRVSTQSATLLDQIPGDSVDFVFTDPPFGGNLNYSELNVLVEAWIGVQTNTKLEAIINDTQKKGLHEYQVLLEESFAEYFRVLKPGRYIVVEFHNTKNVVWKAIQEALWKAGFVVANVASLDKVKGTTKQLSYAATVKQDLIITGYKPAGIAQPKSANLSMGTEKMLWTFVEDHLGRVPVFLARDEMAEVITERTGPTLFDRAVAVFVMRGWSVPLSAGEFYAALSQKFVEREGMYFLPVQVGRYEKQRAKVERLQQLNLFVNDEVTAIQWIREELRQKPQTFQSLQPAFLKEVQTWARHERTMELKDLLDDSFLCYTGEGPVPSQIHSYLSSNFEDCRNLDEADRKLKDKAVNRWYVPDMGKQGDLEALRLKRLLAEFHEYKSTSKKKLKELRTEAIRAGFKASYDVQDYETIVRVAGKLPEQVVQEDDTLLMYFDVASTRLGG